MKLKMLVMLCSIAISGCSEPSTPMDNTQKISTKLPAEVHYPSADLDKPIAHVEITDDAGILESAGVKGQKIDTKGETDLKGEPYKSYKFNEGLSASIQLSSSRVMVSWYKIEDEPDGFEISVKSLRIAQNISRALMGDDGARMVDSVMAGNDKTTTIVSGVNVDRANCGGGICMIVMNRR